MYYKKIKQKKFFLLILLIIVVFFILLLFSKKIQNDDIDNLCLVFSPDEKVCFQDANLFYDKLNDIYYFPINIAYKNKEFSFELLKDDKTKKYYINNSILSNSTYNLNYTDTFNYRVIENDVELIKRNIKFTNNQIINISIDNNIYDGYRKASFYIIDTYGSKNNNSYINKITIKNRGNTSRAFPKMAYRLKFDNSGIDFIENSSILKENNSWALDAMYTDSSKIRNRLATDIWNFINNIDDDYDNLNVIYHELYINNEYSGLYSIKNIINEKKLNINQTNTINSGILLKGVNYDPIDWVTKDFNNIQSSLYHSLEMKYPNKSLYYSKYWSIILNKLAIYYTTRENKYDNINEVFDIKNFLDYKIYLELLSAADNNYINNSFLSMKDVNSKVLITPWDLDLTFGLYYTDVNSPLLSEKKYDLVNQPMNQNNYEGDKEYINALKARYKYLRENGLNKEFVISLIDKYVEEIYYASIRDSERWYEYDIIKETKEIKDWISKRFGFLDTKFKEL